VRAGGVSVIGCAVQTVEAYMPASYITDDPVILPTEPRASWAEFMAMRDELGPFPEDFLADRQQGSESRDPLSGWHE